jgi:hypothetical protein
MVVNHAGKNHDTSTYFFSLPKIVLHTTAFSSNIVPLNTCLPIFFTKPLQGALFLSFLNIRMGYTLFSLSSDPIISSTFKERVAVKTKNIPNHVKNMAEPLDSEPLDHLSIGVLPRNGVSPKKNDNGTSPKKNDSASPKIMYRSCFSHASKEHNDRGPHTTRMVVKPTQKIRFLEPVRFREQRHSDGQEYQNKQREGCTPTLCFNPI